MSRGCWTDKSWHDVEHGAEKLQRMATHLHLLVYGEKEADPAEVLRQVQRISTELHGIELAAAWDAP